MIRFGNPYFAVFTELNPNLAQLSNLTSLLAQPFSTKDASLTLMSYHPKVGNFWSSGCKLWILFITARTLCHYVCELASSSNIQLCFCAHDYPAMLSRRKELRLFYYVNGSVLILEFNLQWWFLLPPCYLHRLVFPSNPLSSDMLKH
jgi:hypothetical protein